MSKSSFKVIINFVFFKDGATYFSVADHDRIDSSTIYPIEEGYISIILHCLFLRYFANNHNKSISFNWNLWFIYFINEELLILVWQFFLVVSFKNYRTLCHLHFFFGVHLIFFIQSWFKEWLHYVESFKTLDKIGF